MRFYNKYLNLLEELYTIVARKIKPKELCWKSKIMSRSRQRDKFYRKTDLWNKRFTSKAKVGKKNVGFYYRAMLRIARLRDCMSSDCPSVCDVEVRFHTVWNTSEITPTWAIWWNGNTHKNWGGKGCGQEHIKAANLRIGATLDQGYYYGLIGSHIRAFDWHQNQWLWMTLNLNPKVKEYWNRSTFAKIIVTKNKSGTFLWPTV